MICYFGYANRLYYIWLPKSIIMKNITRPYLSDLTYLVNGAAIEVHKALGPGLLESVYHRCLKHELSLLNVNFISEMIVPFNYKGLDLEVGLRCDLFIEDCLVVEIKAIEAILPIHEAQLLTYMNILQAPKGIMLNFHCTNMYKYGQKTYVNKLFSQLLE